MVDKDNCWKLVPLERSYDMRARAIIAFNTATANGADRDDALQAAWEAELLAAPAAPAPTVPSWYEVKSEHGFLSKNRPVQWVAESGQGYLWGKKSGAADMVRKIRAEGIECEVVPIAAPAPAAQAGADVQKLLTAASNALRSYQYGNASSDLAEAIADRIDAAMANAATTEVG